MYLFFMVCGFLFVVGFSIVLNYLYEFFSINKFTEFLVPTTNTVFNRISIIIIPNVLWSLIEMVLLGSNYYFIMGFWLNIFVSLCVMYVIKYGYRLFSNSDNNLVNIIAICVSCFFGFVINYICLLIGVNREIDMLYSMIGVGAFIALFMFVKLFPPKSDFFRRIDE